LLVEDLETLEYDRTSILGNNQSRSARVYGSPDNIISESYGSGGARNYQPPRDLFDDV